MPLNSTILPALLALGSALCFGTADFSAGLVTRRFDVLRAVLYANIAAMLATAALGLLRAEPISSLADLGWGLLSGLSGMMGLAFLMRGFATGRMGIVAPVSGILAAALPVIFSGFSTGLPGGLTLAGFGVALPAIWLLSRPDASGGSVEGLGAALLSGLGFGGFFVALGQVSEGALFWPLCVARAGTCIVLLIFALLRREQIGLPVGSLALPVFSGVISVTGDMLFLLAVQSGRLDVAAVLGSLYPAVTALLAHRFIQEHLTRVQWIGLGAAVLAIALITL